MSENWGSPADPTGTGLEDVVAKLDREDILRIEAMRAASTVSYGQNGPYNTASVVDRADRFYTWLTSGD
jgi:hypothetical protein